MRNSGYFKDKNVTVVGLARSGVACANLLWRLGARVAVTEIKDNPSTREAGANLASPQIKIEIGRHTPQIIRQAELVVLSPGVPMNTPCVKWAAEFGKPLISEIEVASILCPAQMVAVTGANGKTTVTTLIGKILQAAGKKVIVCGNIGNPFTGEVEKLNSGDYAVLELSSFQLETIKDFKPKVALILNLTPNHLDRYQDLREYLEAKQRIFMNQDKDDFLVLNGDDPLLRESAGLAKSQVVFFKKENGKNPNHSAVEAVGRILGVAQETMDKVFAGFKGIEHRMEEVASIKGVKFINDSKATTADSAIWAIKNISTPIILIAGGRHKGIDYGVIAPASRGKVKQAILIGEAKDIIERDLSGAGFALQKCPTLEEAVQLAYAKASSGDSVLLSPMCSSYDMFKDYEERGRTFKKIVMDLKKKEEPA